MFFKNKINYFNKQEFFQGRIYSLSIIKNTNDSLQSVQNFFFFFSPILLLSFDSFPDDLFVKLDANKKLSRQEMYYKHNSFVIQMENKKMYEEQG